MLDDINYGDTLNARLGTINDNFDAIVNSNLLKGEPGVSIITEKKSFDSNGSAGIYDGRIHRWIAEIICGAQSVDPSNNSYYDPDNYDTADPSAEVVAVMNNIKNKFIILQYEKDGEDKKIVSCIPFVYIDPRTIEAPGEGNTYTDLSCTVYYDVAGDSFVKEHNFPTLYYDTNSSLFKWRIHGQNTELVAKGPAGMDGTNGNMMLVKYNPSDYKITGVWMNDLDLSQNYTGSWVEKYQPRNPNARNGDVVVGFPNSISDTDSEEVSTCVVSTLIKGTDSWYIAQPKANDELASIYRIAIDKWLENSLDAIGTDGFVDGLYVPMRESDILTIAPTQRNGRGVHMIKSGNISEVANGATMNIGYHSIIDAKTDWDSIDKPNSRQKLEQLLPYILLSHNKTRLFKYVGIENIELNEDECEYYRFCHISDRTVYNILFKVWNDENISSSSLLGIIDQKLQNKRFRVDPDLAIDVDTGAVRNYSEPSIDDVILCDLYSSRTGIGNLYSGNIKSLEVDAEVAKIGQLEVNKMRAAAGTDDQVDVYGKLYVNGSLGVSGNLNANDDIVFYEKNEETGSEDPDHEISQTTAYISCDKTKPELPRINIVSKSTNLQNTYSEYYDQESHIKIDEDHINIESDAIEIIGSSVSVTGNTVYLDSVQSLELNQHANISMDVIYASDQHTLVIPAYWKASDDEQIEEYGVHYVKDWDQISSNYSRISLSDDELRYDYWDEYGGHRLRQDGWPGLEDRGCSYRGTIWRYDRAMTAKPTDYDKKSYSKDKAPFTNVLINDVNRKVSWYLIPYGVTNIFIKGTVQDEYPHVLILPRVNAYYEDNYDVDFEFPIGYTINIYTPYALADSKLFIMTYEAFCNNQTNGEFNGFVPNSEKDNNPTLISLQNNGLANCKDCTGLGAMSYRRYVFVGHSGLGNGRIEWDDDKYSCYMWQEVYVH